MKIRNNTKWNTADCRKIICEAKRRVDRIEGKHDTQGLIVKIENAKYRNWGRPNTIGGTAHIGYWGITMKIGKGIAEMTEEQIKRFASVFVHEYYHNLGVRKIDYRNYENDWTKDLDYSWTKNYQIRLKEVKPKEIKDVKAIRYQRAQMNLTKSLTRFKRAKTLLKKWQNKVKYYEKSISFANKKGQ